MATGIRGFFYTRHAMFDAPLHPKVVHIPIALSVLMPFLTLGLLVAWYKEWLPARSWWIAIAFQAILFGGAIVAQETGENEEERVEEVLTSEEPLEVHEEAASRFV